VATSHVRDQDGLDSRYSHAGLRIHKPKTRHHKPKQDTASASCCAGAARLPTSSLDLAPEPFLSSDTAHTKKETDITQMTDCTLPP
jgi:hypothetical protein